MNPVRARHRDEKAEQVARQRGERQRLDQELIKEQAKDLPLQREPADADKRRGELTAKHDRERDAMDERHRKEFSAAQRQHTIE